MTDGLGLSPDRILSVDPGVATFCARIGTKRGLHPALDRLHVYKRAGLRTLLDINADGKARFVGQSPMGLVLGSEHTFGVGSNASIQITQPFPLIEVGQMAQVSDHGPQLRFMRYQDDLPVFKVTRAGVMNPADGVVLPGVALPVSESDNMKAIKAAVDAGVDEVALSFVEDPDSVARLAMVDVPILAKIETALGVLRAPQIAAAIGPRGGLCAAGGDLLPNVEFHHYAESIRRIADAAAEIRYVGATSIWSDVLRTGVPSRSDLRSLGFECMCRARGIIVTDTNSVHLEVALAALVQTIGVWSGGASGRVDGGKGSAPRGERPPAGRAQPAAEQPVPARHELLEAK